MIEKDLIIELEFDVYCRLSMVCMDTRLSSCIYAGRYYYSEHNPPFEANWVNATQLSTRLKAFQVGYTKSLSEIG